MRNIIIGLMLLVGMTAVKAQTLQDGEKIVHGVCRQNLQWVKQPAEVEKIADNIASTKIPLVRLSGAKENGSIEQVIRNINTFTRKDIKVLLIQPLTKEMFPAGYQQVPGPNFKVFKMSDIDLDRFSSFINELVEELARNTAEGAVVGFELFNEANWGDFNGDLQPTPDGKGEIFTLATPLDKPSFADIYAGIGKYGKCLEITRKALDTHFPKKNVKLVTNGMVSSGGWDNFRWQINRGISLVLPDMFLTILQGNHPQQQDKTNYLAFADAIGLHGYPPLEDDMLATLHTYYFDPINAVLDTPKPVWITEWGFARNKFDNDGGEATRLIYINKFIEALDKISNVEITTFYEFDASKNHNIWENGKLLESGTFFQNIYK